MAGAVRRTLLPLAGPLDLEATLFSGQDFRWEREGEGFAGWLGDAPVLLRPREGYLEAFSPLPEGEAVARLRRLFRWDDRGEEVRGVLASDPLLARALARWPGLRLLHLEPWPALASFICSAHAHLPRITRMVRALSSALGEPVEFLGRVRWRFPTPHALARAGEGALRSLGLGFRAKALGRTARLLAQEAVSLEALALLPTPLLRRRLLALPGVGEKVADCVLLLGFGRTEAFPIDRWVRRALVEGYALPPPHTYRRLQGWARERWGVWAGYAQLYLFHAWRTGCVLY